MKLLGEHHFYPVFYNVLSMFSPQLNLDSHVAVSARDNHVDRQFIDDVYTPPSHLQTHPDVYSMCFLFMKPLTGVSLATSQLFVQR